jgi:hypothetical protein
MYSFAETVSLLNRAVEEKGADFVYKQPEGPGNSFGMCQYWHYTNEAGTEAVPGCIVGQVSAYLGLTWEDVIDTIGNPQEQEALTERFDKDSIALLTYVQELQDSGYNWGRAVEEGIDKISPLIKDNADASYSSV